MVKKKPPADKACIFDAREPAGVAPAAPPPATGAATARRHFLQAVLALPAVPLLASCQQYASDTTQAHSSFFTDAERRFVEAATARLIPSDGTPGAKEAAVPTFIERQLAGPFGAARNWYMQGPWHTGTQQQGYQSDYTPAQLYRAAIKRINELCRRQFNKDFEALAAADQDKVLHALENGKMKLGKVPAPAFFSMLWQNTQEGFLADPMYGGNRNFAGWKLIGFPGPRYNYVEDIRHYGKPYGQPTVGLLGRDGTRTLKG